MSVANVTSALLWAPVAAVALAPDVAAVLDVAVIGIELMDMELIEPEEVSWLLELQAASTSRPAAPAEIAISGRFIRGLL